MRFRGEMIIYESEMVVYETEMITYESCTQHTEWSNFLKYITEEDKG